MVDAMKAPLSPILVPFILAVTTALVGDSSKVHADSQNSARTRAKDREPVTRVWDSARIFPYQQAEQARQLAQAECKPLVIHFIPDTKVGASQLNTFYAGKYRVPEDVLNDVVILVVPTDRYAPFARELGVTGPGGFRSVSAYALTPFIQEAVPTCKSGFR